MSAHPSTETAPAVSVIIPTYKRRHVLRRAIDSVLAQTFTDFEIIVVDDHSEDGSDEIVASYADPRIRFFSHETNRGGNAARTTGIDAARGEWLAFLDSDDAYRPTKLEKQLALLAAKGEAYGLCSVWVEHRDGEGNLVLSTTPDVDGWIETDLLACNYLGGFSSIVVRRSALHEVGGLDPRMKSAQDWEFFTRVATVVAACVVREPLLDYLADPDDPVRITTNNTNVILGLRHMFARLLANRDRLTDAQRHTAVRYFTGMFAINGATGDVAYVLRQQLTPLRPGTVLGGAHMLVRSVRKQVRAAAEGQRRAAEDLAANAPV